MSTETPKSSKRHLIVGDPGVGGGDRAMISLAKSRKFAGQHLPREIFAPPRLAAPELASRMKERASVSWNIRTVLRSCTTVFLPKVSKSFYLNFLNPGFKSPSVTIKRSPSGRSITVKNIVPPTPPPLLHHQATSSEAGNKGGKTFVPSS